MSEFGKLYLCLYSQKSEDFYKTFLFYINSPQYDTEKEYFENWKLDLEYFYTWNNKSYV